MRDKSRTARAGPALPLWFCLCYTLFYLSDTVANVPYEALGPELTSNHHERNKLFFTSKVFMLIGERPPALIPPVTHLAAQAAWRCVQQSPRQCSDIASPFMLHVMLL